MDFIDTLPEYTVTSINSSQYIVYDSSVLGDIQIDSVDFGVVLDILDNRDLYRIRDILKHFTYDIIHVDLPYYYPPTLKHYLVKLLDFNHDT